MPRQVSRGLHEIAAFHLIIGALLEATGNELLLLQTTIVQICLDTGAAWELKIFGRLYT
jgi:hypothetical protein